MVLMTSWIVAKVAVKPNDIRKHWYLPLPEVYDAFLFAVLFSFNSPVAASAFRNDNAVSCPEKSMHSFKHRNER